MGGNTGHGLLKNREQEILSYSQVDIAVVAGTVWECNEDSMQLEQFLLEPKISDRNICIVAVIYDCL